ncbi:hypothetical protein LCL95_06945 [Bacillus timonensis]|nr:hypothetical protein [Bacillus timonensis]
MRKILSSIFMTIVFFCAVSPHAFAGGNWTLQEVEKEAEDTNIKIENEIAKAVKEANKMHKELKKDLRKIELGKKVYKLLKEKEKVEWKLTEENDEKKRVKLEEKLAEIEAEIREEEYKIESDLAEIELDIAALEEVLFSLNAEKDQVKISEKIEKRMEKLNEKSRKHKEKLLEFSIELNELIQDLRNKTDEMSLKMRTEALEHGYLVECTWQEVELAGEKVWIDPLRVIGFSR